MVKGDSGVHMLGDLRIMGPTPKGGGDSASVSVWSSVMGSSGESRKSSSRELKTSVPPGELGRLDMLMPAPGRLFGTAVVAAALTAATSVAAVTTAAVVAAKQQGWLSPRGSSGGSSSGGGSGNSSSSSSDTIFAVSPF
ncbi:unnamed protein product [Sphagnum tenellum]